MIFILERKNHRQQEICFYLLIFLDEQLSHRSFLSKLVHGIGFNADEALSETLIDLACQLGPLSLTKRSIY